MKHKRSDRLDNFPYQVKMIKTHVREEHVKWLQETMPNGYLYRWTYGGPHQINFADEKDRLMFTMRWA